ncbi:putative nucleobase-ascorbate transporter 10 [Tripterygium wilfordii]|uniref:Putative nucleobase-ascorbate transporter 10 n=1 Tax=Tripterygium wilfordii TaxID=458696 RepID=A0A7J7CH49_TRIWF|nr:putative nucleobase-ascorbate transporter 10 [Tripterygium wilfordii]
MAQVGAGAAGGGGGGGGGGGANNKKPEELQPHPVKEQLPGVQYCINSPPPWRQYSPSISTFAFLLTFFFYFCFLLTNFFPFDLIFQQAEAIVLGFQHYILTLGITVLIPSIIVPQMGGGDAEKVRVIQTLLFVSGLSTLFQTLFGSRLPTVAVGSYAYIVPTTSILLSSRYTSYVNPHERFVLTMRGIQGALIITACFQMVMGFLGLWRNAVRFLSPLAIVPYVTFTGLGLYYLGFPSVRCSSLLNYHLLAYKINLFLLVISIQLAKCVEIGLPQIVAIVFIAQYLPNYLKSKRPFCDRFALLFSVGLVWFFAQLLTASGVYNHRRLVTQISCRTDRSGLVTSAPWFYIPYPLQWGNPTFNAEEAFAMMAASFVSLFESTGTFFATSRYGSATPVPPSVVSRGVGWLGVGVLLNGMFGSVTGLTASVENAGLLALTKVGSRRVIQISAGFMIFFSIFGKIGAFFASVPLPIIAATYCILCGYVSSAGLGFLQFCNLNSFRTKFILGFSFFLGISVPQYFREYYQLHSKCDLTRASSGWFNDVVIVIFSSHTTVAALVALFLDRTLCCETEETRKDSGLKWWEKFSLYNSDVRNDEFYALPCRLNKLFPAL